MEVAVSIDRLGLLIHQMEADLGSFAGVQILSLDALVGYQRHPFDPVNVHHGMIHRTHIDFHRIAIDLHRRNMLFTAGVYRIGDQFIHLLAAADGADTCIMDHLNNIAAVGADIKFHVFHI